MSNPEQRLIDMANQIATNLALQGSEEEAVEKIASHIKRFWARPMKQQLVEYSQQDNNALMPLTQRAVAQLSR